MSPRDGKIVDEKSALAVTGDSRQIALENAIAIWSDATTNTISSRRQDIRRDKQNAVISFFDHAQKQLPDITPLDVKAWQVALEAKGLARTTVYYRLCHLSSFYS